MGRSRRGRSRPESADLQQLGWPAGERPEPVPQKSGSRSRPPNALQPALTPRRFFPRRSGAYDPQEPPRALKPSCPFGPLSRPAGAYDAQELAGKLAPELGMQTVPSLNIAYTQEKGYVTADVAEREKLTKLNLSGAWGGALQFSSAWTSRQGGSLTAACVGLGDRVLLTKAVPRREALLHADTAPAPPRSWANHTVVVVVVCHRRYRCRHQVQADAARRRGDPRVVCVQVGRARAARADPGEPPPRPHT